MLSDMVDTGFQILNPDPTVTTEGILHVSLLQLLPLGDGHFLEGICSMEMLQADLLLEGQWGQSGHNGHKGWLCCVLGPAPAAEGWSFRRLS